MRQASGFDDVPSPIDLRDPADAAQWAATAMAKRPWRESLFGSIVAELGSLGSDGGERVLELGSGPGFLARRILESLPRVEYTAVDFSAAMHALARERLGPLVQRARFVQSDFKTSGWTSGLSSYHAVVTVQAVHELRHKRHAVDFYKLVAPLLLPCGLFLVCDHVCGEHGMTNESLFMSLEEHRHALREAGFSAHEVRHEGGLVLYRAQLAKMGMW